MESLIIAMVPAPEALRQHLTEVHGPGIEAALDDALLTDALVSATGFAVCAHPSDNNRKIAFAIDTSREDAVSERCRQQGFRVRTIESGDWAGGLTAIIESEFDRGARSVGLLSGLAPSTPPHLLEQAFRALLFHPVVAGPDLAGLTYFFGMQRPLPDFFPRLDWDPMPDICQVLGVQTRPQTVHLLPFWTQLGTAAGLSWFASHTSYRATDNTEVGAASAALLQRHAAWGSMDAKLSPV